MDVPPQNNGHFMCPICSYVAFCFVIIITHWPNKYLLHCIIFLVMISTSPIKILCCLLPQKYASVRENSVLPWLPFLTVTSSLCGNRWKIGTWLRVVRWPWLAPPHRASVTGNFIGRFKREIITVFQERRSWMKMERTNISMIRSMVER